MNYFWGSSSSEKKSDESLSPETAKRRLRCRIGPSINTLSVYNVNDDANPHFIDSPYFTGSIVVRIKNFNGITPDNKPPIKNIPYFESKRRQFSIQLSGRFKQVKLLFNV
jgi:hypothetical protein